MISYRRNHSRVEADLGPMYIVYGKKLAGIEPNSVTCYLGGPEIVNSLYYSLYY